MRRRAFLRTGLAAGAWGIGGLGGIAAAPDRLWAERRPQGDGPIRLASNENPLGIAPAAREAIIAELGDANRYPRRRGELLEAVAAKHRVGPEEVVLAAGSTEVLKMAVQAFAGASGTLVLADPTYEDAPFYADPFGTRVVEVPLTATHEHDLAAMRAATESASGPSLVYLCNPNNPTGTLTPSAAIDAWIAEAPETTWFLVDEAYADYVDDPGYSSALKWIPDRPNVVVARTFSKVYGMAGIRLGYGIANERTARALDRAQVRNNANHVAISAGLASLGAEDFVRRSLDVNTRGKGLLLDCLRELNLAALPSHTNFVMHRITGSLEAYRRSMRDAGIWVGRPFPPMLDHCRVSIGLPDEMATLVETMRTFRREGRL